LCQFFDASPKELGFRAGITQSGLEVPEDALVDALLEPAGATIKLSWLDYPTAYGHFLKMERLGEVAGDSDLRALAAVHQGDLLRRRGEYELAVQRLEAAVPAASGVGGVVEGMRQQTLARAHAEYGRKDAFLQAIDAAEAQAAGLGAETADWGNEFSITNVRHERAHGHTLLWEPEVALGIYLATESGLHPISLRDIGNFTILKAQAHSYAGNVDVGVNLAIEGLGFARRYGSARHVSRVQRMHDRLSDTPIGLSARMRDLADALRAA
jgi:hypothetical protein